MSTSNGTKIILSNTYTTSDMNRRLGLLEEFLDHKSFSGHDIASGASPLEVFLKESKKEDTKEAKALAEWGDEFYAEFEKGNSVNMLNAIKEELGLLPTIQIYFPAMFSAEEFKSVGEWLRKNINENILMEVSIDMDMIGGCGFVWNGVYHDFSFRNFIAKHTDELASMIREYDA